MYIKGQFLEFGLFCNEWRIENIWCSRGVAKCSLEQYLLDESADYYMVLNSRTAL